MGVWVLSLQRTRRKKENGREKIEYIYNEYRNLMLSKAYGILKDRGLAEKALHESFVCLWKNIHLIDDPRSSRAIVFAVTIVRNCAYALAQNKSKKALSGSRQERSRAGETKAFDARGLRDALYGMSATDTIKVVNKLGGQNKNIFLLKYEFGFSAKKIAATLNDMENNVTERVRRTQKKLRALLLRGWD